MINSLFAIVIQWIVRLRYRVRVKGLPEVLRRGRRGILFLPNHPALIDPIILMSRLLPVFAQRALADADQIDRFFIRWLARRSGVRPIPDISALGAKGRDRIEEALAESIEGLKAGENLLLYPAGRIYRSRLEDLGGNSAVEVLLGSVPDLRVVLVRTRGLWGSSFSRAGGRTPEVGGILLGGLKYLLLGGLFFMPRRPVEIELFEPADLPRTAGRDTLNRYMERFYNEDAPPNTYIPLTRFEPQAPSVRPEPRVAALAGDSRHVPEATRELVMDHLCELSGKAEIRDEDRLANDLGLDSLARADVVVWLEKEFGFPAVDVESLQKVSDVLLSACGEGIVTGSNLKPVSTAWFIGSDDGQAACADGATIAQAFLEQARRAPGRVVIADQAGGARTYRDLVTAVMLLRPVIEKFEGEHVGILLPASVGASVCYLATLLAGKTPVMVNWTVGPRNLLHCLDLVGVRRVLTASALVQRLNSDGALASIQDRIVMLDEIVRGLGMLKKLSAWLRARLSWGDLGTKVSPTAAVLFTSGSENLPKAVPLTHANILANLRDLLQAIHIRRDDVLLGMLPPFHSFGLTVGMLLPLCAAVRVVFHPSPTEAVALAAIVESYRATLLIGTPTFLGSIVRAAAGEQLATLRLAVTGAEKCSPRVYEAIAARCPQAVIIEGYGVTECSPVVSFNREDLPKPFTIGKVLPSFEYAIVDVDRDTRAVTGQPGMLLLRGPCVFNGYVGTEAASPFVEFEGKSWYRTGDLVSEDAEGVLTFRGRLKRFVKIGGEMISLPAIEAVLSAQFVSLGAEENGPCLAVEATPSEDRPEIVLFTTLDLDRNRANEAIARGGLSPLHNIRRVIKLDAIPVLGTGKTDYRALKKQLEV